MEVRGYIKIAVIEGKEEGLTESLKLVVITVRKGSSSFLYKDLSERHRFLLPPEASLIVCQPSGNIPRVFSNKAHFLW